MWELGVFLLWLCRGPWKENKHDGVPRHLICISFWHPGDLFHSVWGFEWRVAPAVRKWIDYLSSFSCLLLVARVDQPPTPNGQFCPCVLTLMKALVMMEPNPLNCGWKVIIHPGQVTSPWSDWQPQSCSLGLLALSVSRQGGLLSVSAGKPKMRYKLSYCGFLRARTE